MKNKLLIIIGIAFLLFAALIGVDIIISTIGQHSFFDTRGLVKTLITVCVVTGVGIILLIKGIKNERIKRNIVKGILGAALVVYLFMLFNLLISTTHPYVFSDYKAYFGANANLVPFKTIFEYLRMIATGNLVSISVTNLGGNFILLMPFGLLLPCLFERMRKFGWFLLTVFLIDILIEVTQLFLVIRTCDIDDIILNVAGAVIFFLICRLPFVQKVFHKMHLL